MQIRLQIVYDDGGRLSLIQDWSAADTVGYLRTLADHIEATEISEDDE